MNAIPNARAAGATASLLNIGCGATFHADWTNLDTSPVAPGIIGHDLRRRLPFAEATFDAVYGSHVLEHLEPSAAGMLLQDCLRVLKPEGIVRLAVPDLESIARLYVAALEGALAGDREAEMRYDWLMLELYDQAARHLSGGRMAAWLAEHEGRDRPSFVSGRLGLEAAPRTAAADPPGATGFRIRRRLRWMARSLRTAAATASAFLLLGPRGAAALREGLFRSEGEVHRWMYDRFSLARALKRAGFASVRVCAAGESAIPGFSGYRLEIDQGRERKPDSLYMEARKPASR